MGFRKSPTVLAGAAEVMVKVNIMRILALDDDPVFREILRTHLERLNHHDVVYCASGEEALHAVTSARQPYECCLCDIEMPGMNGIEFVHSLRDTEKGKRTPVVMITSRGDQQSIDGAFKAGALDYLTKPIDLNDVRGRLNAVERIQRENRRFESMKAMLRDHSNVEQSLEAFEEPVTLDDVEGLMHFAAIRNYLETVGRMRLMNHAALCIHIDNGSQLYNMLTGSAFMDMLGDVAEIVREELKTEHHMLAYAGSGDFVALLARLTAIDPGELEHLLNASVDIFYDNLEELEAVRPRILCGPVVRPSLLHLGAASNILDKARSLAQFPLPHRSRAHRSYQEANA
jgi:CheY-like chemotaxis protein